MIDDLISAEIPDPVENPQLYERVMKHMVHGPCINYKEGYRCKKNNICVKNYPKDSNPKTIANIDGYPLYKRNSGRYRLINNEYIDDRWIVPYNGYLIMKYDCHINLEICTSIKAVKYLFKYIYKGKI